MNARGGGLPLRHWARWVGIGVAVVLVVTAVAVATRPSVQASPADSPLVGRAAPGFSATSFSGARVTLDQYRGRYLFVNFFASWCGPCQQEAPHLVTFAFEQSRSADGAALVSVDFSDTTNGARQFIATYGPTWPSLKDPGGTIAYNYGVSSPPTTFLVTPTGKIFSMLVGPVTAGQLTSELAQARAAARPARQG